jgi:hypothetical protein
MKDVFYALILLLCLGDSKSLWAATNLVAKKEGVPLLKEARKDAPALRLLKAGETLEAETRQGMYWKVKLAEGGFGYVSFLAVQHQATEDNSLQGALREQAIAARKEANEEDNVRARSAVMGVRGLAESSEVSSAGQLRPDTAAVYAMEERQFEAERIEGLGTLVLEEAENAWKARQEP